MGKAQIKNRLEIFKKKDSQKEKVFLCRQSRRRRRAPGSSCSLEEPDNMPPEKLRKIEEFAKTVADGTNKNYLEHMSTLPRSASDPAPQIENKVISVAMTDEHAFAAYSSEYKPGFVAVYEHRDFEAPQLLRQQYSELNTKVFGEKVVISTDPVRKAQLETEIEGLKMAPSKTKLREFVTENPEAKMQTFPEFAQEKTIQWLTQQLENGVPIQTGKAFQKFFNSEILNVRDKTYKEIMTELIKDKVKFAGITQQRDKIADRLNGWAKESRKGLEVWTETNCAEPHVVTLHGVAGKEIPQAPNIGNDLKYIAAYDVINGGVGIKPKPRCKYCLVTTKHIKHVLTDSQPTANSGPIFGQSSEVGNSQSHPVAENSASKSAGDKSFAGRLDGDVDRNAPKRTRSIDDDQSYDSMPRGTQSQTHWNTISDWLHRGVASVKGLLEWPRHTNTNTNTNTNARFDNSSAVTQQIDTNGTIMLLEVLSRKMTGDKRTFRSESHLYEDEVTGYAIDITEKFEEIVERAIEASHISLDEMHFDFIQLQSELMKKMRAGKFSEIAELLNKFVEDVYFEAEYVSNFSAEQFNNFTKILDKEMEKLLDQIFSQLLNGEERQTSEMTYEQFNSDSSHGNSFDDNILTLNHTTEFLRF